jgi:hypothetical protein
LVTLRSDLERRRRPDDLGITSINQVFKLWQVDDQWSVSESRGFAWWAGSFRQRISVDAGQTDQGVTVYRLSAETDLFRGVDQHAVGIAERLSVLNRFSSSSAITLDEGAGRISLCSSVVLHEQNAEWIVPHFATLAILQPIDAQLRGPAYAPLIGGALGVSAHPRSGPRTSPDQMLDLLAEVYEPTGKASSRWLEGDEFEQTAATLRSYGAFVSNDRSGLTADVEFGSDSALLTATTEEAHPQLGHGVLLRLNLPVTLPAAAAGRLALEFNATEGSTFTGSHFLGAWCSAEARGGHVPVFVSFIPNVAYRRGLLASLILSLMAKARWARNEIAPYADDATLEAVLRKRLGIA